jgi:hypothetical protein
MAKLTSQNQATDNSIVREPDRAGGLEVRDSHVRDHVRLMLNRMRDRIRERAAALPVP